VTTPDLAISSTTNPRVKAAVRLRDRREREETGLTIVDGPRELLRALDHGIAVAEAFVCDELIRSSEAEEAVRRLRIAGASTIQVSPSVMSKIAFGDRSDGVVAVIHSPETLLDRLTLPPLPRQPLIVVVESIEKPGNFGAILRTADGASADAVIAADPLTDPFNPNAIRASLGTIFSMPIATATTSATLEWLSTNGIRPIGARVDALQLYTEVDLRGPIAIVLGSEAGGLSAAWDEARSDSVAIPMLGAADSLNVSVAAAILLYEARRQRSSGTWA
jgi:RNA methyltransferase, TrmH family